MLQCKYRKTGNPNYRTEYKRVGNQVHYMTRKVQRKKCCSGNIEKQEILTTEYKRVGNHVHHMTRDVQQQHKVKMADSVKDSLKVYLKYLKSKSKAWVLDLYMDNSRENITKTDQEKANALVDFFTSVFTVEQNSEIRDLDIKVVLKLDTLNIDIELVCKKLESQRIDKITRPRWIITQNIKITCLSIR